MLDIDKLSAEFDDFLSQFDEDAINEWIKFDDERLATSQLIDGETITAVAHNYPSRTSNLTNQSVYGSDYINDEPLAIAA